MANVNFKNVYSNSLVDVDYDESAGILKNTWKTKLITLEETQTEMAEWMKKFEEKKPKLLLTNNLVGQILLPEIQKWIGDFLFPKITDMGLKRWAIVLSSDLFSNISVEQMLEDSEKPKNEFAQRFFEMDEEAAIKWLLQFK